VQVYDDLLFERSARLNRLDSFAPFLIKEKRRPRRQAKPSNPKASNQRRKSISKGRSPAGRRNSANQKPKIKEELRAFREAPL
jgi:hypothetical protein